MLEIVVRGGPKTGKSMVATLIYSILEMVGVNVSVNDPNGTGMRQITIQGIGSILRRMFSENEIVIRTEQTSRTSSERTAE